MRGRSRSSGRRGDRDGEHNGRELDNDFVLETPCIWIRGCPDDLTEREVERACAKFGMVQDINIKNSDRETLVVVRFHRLRDARDAIYGLDQTVAFGAGAVTVEPMDGRYREVDYRGRSGRYSRGRRDNGNGGSDRRDRRRGDGGGRRHSRERSASRQYAPRPVRIYLSQLPRDMEEDEFTEIVAEYGEILQYELHREGAYKCGWVEYASKGEAEAALSELDDRRMDDWNMRLQAYMYPGGGP